MTKVLLARDIYSAITVNRIRQIPTKTHTTAVATTLCVYALHIQMNGSVWRLGDALCDTWVAFDVMCCTSSILNLTAISIDRLIACLHPATPRAVVVN